MSQDQILGLIVVAMYVVGLWITRWTLIARPNARLATMKIEAVKQRSDDTRVRALLKHATDKLAEEDWPSRGGSGRPGLGKLPRWLFMVATWNGSRALLAWGLAHEAERLAVETIPIADVHARMRRGLSELRELPEAEAEHWREVLTDSLGDEEQRQEDRVRRILDRLDLTQSTPAGRRPRAGWPGRRAPSANPTGILPPSDEEKAVRATLAQFLKALYDDRDRKAVELSTGENKVTWLILIALLLIAALVLQNYETIMLAGAIGGLLSRMRRVVQRQELLSDYGSSWSVLFLTPVAGALVAWAGLLLLVALQEAAVVSVSFLEGDQEPLTNPDVSVLAVAVVLGYFGRFFETIAGQTAGASI